MAWYEEPYPAEVWPVQTPIAASLERWRRRPAAQRRMPFVLLCAVLTSALLFGRVLPYVFAATGGGDGAAAPFAALSPDASQDAGTAQAAVAEAAAPPADLQLSSGPAAAGVLSPVFTREVLHWEPQIVRWAEAHGVEPNLAAIIMQIESCGHPDVASHAGAQGLFQVMPFHFAAGEVMVDPDTNAHRGLTYFVERLNQTNGDIGRAFAGYNGGHRAAASSWDQWANETQRYYRWSTGIYQDIQNGLTESPTVQAWLQAGGASLCRQAADRLGLN
ncbi:MAG: transglycosylase SLT domain-containing protein [Candidatus Promineifilaceae bacterium]|nr:transglycosylase SLT domain-containing protein [Candidatus Promineifilaceae bacterium]